MLLSSSERSKLLAESELRVVINNSSIEKVNTVSLVNKRATVVTSENT